MKNLLCERGLLKYIEERNDITEYDTNEDAQALAEIQFTLSTAQTKLTLKSTTAHDTWKRLKVKHMHTSESNLMFLKNQFTGLKMNNKETMSEYIVRIDEMAEQISSLSEEEVKDEDKVVIFTRGLPESYRHVVVAIQQAGKITDYSHVTNSLINEESAQNETNGNNKQENAFYTNRGKNRFNRGNRGYRGNRGNHNTNQTERFEGHCRFCNIYGHKESDCRKKQNQRGNPNNRFNARRGNQSYANYGQHSTYENEASYEQPNQLFVADVNISAINVSAVDVSAESAYMMNDSKDQWLLDSGASNHMTAHRDLFTTYETFNDRCVEVNLGNDSKIYALGQGSINMTLDTGNNKTINGTLTNVLHVPDISKNLFSIGKALTQGLTLQFQPNVATFYNKDKPVMTATRQGNMYYVNGTTTYQANTAIDNQSATLWHERLGHIGTQNLQTMVNNNSVEGLPPNLTVNLPLCENCTMNKLTRVPCPLGGKRSNQLLQVIHTDICGPMNTTTRQGSRYFVSFIDDYSRKAVVYFIATKDQAHEKFDEYKNLVENQTGRRIKTLRPDRGGEYVNRNFQQYLRQNGIQHQTTAPYTPQQNGVAERFNRTVIEMSRTMLHTAKLSYDFWAEAVNTATYIRNRCISKALDNNITPEELWSGNKPNIRHLRIFGSTAYVLIKDHQHKFHPKAKKCLFLGYESNSKAYRLWCQDENRIIISRDVKFDEDLSTKTTKKTQLPEIVIEIPKTDHSQNVEPAKQDAEPKAKGKSRMVKELGNNLGSYWKVDTASNEESIQYAHAYVAASQLCEPQTYDQAISSPDAHHWQEAMDSEYASLIKNKTWDLAPLPPDKNIIPTRWLYKVKFKGDGSIERFKARLVAKGYIQEQGIDFEDTYSPVFKLASLRILLSIGAIHDLDIHQMDVKTAFLHGDIDTDIYVQQPQGYDRQYPNLACRLRKGLYGLKQAPRLWNKCIDDFLQQKGFKKCATEPCVYYQQYPTNERAYIGIWVDDIVIVATSSLIESIKAKLSNRFDMTDQDQISYILGISIKRDRAKRQIYLHQKRYIETILERFNMSKANTANTPSDTSNPLQKASDTNVSDPNVPYRQAIGALTYLMLATRPDIAMALNKAAQYSSNHNETHWTAVKRILRYIKATATFKLTLGNHNTSNQEIILSGAADSDWAGDTNDRRSTSGYLFFLNDGLISWQSRKQNSVATSSTQAEYHSLSTAAKESIWIRQFLTEIGHQQSKPTTILQDNQSTIALAHNPINHSRTKHIDVIHHHIRELINQE